MLENESFQLFMQKNKDKGSIKIWTTYTGNYGGILTWCVGNDL